MTELEDIRSQVSPALCVANNLRMVTRLLVQAYEDALRPSGITIGQFSTLGSLSETGPLPMNQLAQVIEVERSTIARNLKPLEREGLIALTPDPKDGRVKIVSLTPKGQQTLEAAAPLWLEVQSHFTGGLGEDQLGELMGMMGQLRGLAEARP